MGRYASMEAYKVNPLITIQKSMAVLAEFPAQVLVLRGTVRIAWLDPRQSNFVEAMIWPEYTQMFPLHAASIPFIGLDDAHMVSNALTLHVRANDLLALQSPEIFREFLELFSAAYSKEALPACGQKSSRDQTSLISFRVWRPMPTAWKPPQILLLAMGAAGKRGNRKCRFDLIDVAAGLRDWLIPRLCVHGPSSRRTSD